MPQQRIRGTTQIIDATINAAKFVASLNLPTAQLQDGALFLRSDGTVAMTAALNLNTQKIINLGTPTAAGDAANKSYVDNTALGLSPKRARKAAIISNVALTGIPTTLQADGVTLVAGDEVLNIAQITPAQNGPWVIAAGAWTRPDDYAAASTQRANPYLYVQQGTLYADNSFVATTDGPITVDTTTTSWTTNGGLAQLVAGAGLTKTGNTVDVGAGNGISVAADSIAVQANGASLNVSGAGVKVSDGTAGQVMLAAPLAGFVTLSGDISSISAAGAVTLSSAFLKATNFVANEIPTGAINGANAAYTLASAPTAGTVEVYQNGLRLLVGAGNDYTISGSTITFVTAPATGDNLLVDYLK